MGVLGHLFGRSKPSKTFTRERRNAVRRFAVEDRALLSWRAGDETSVVPARIKDLSLLGASLVAEGRPPSEAPVWIRLEDPAPTDRVEAHVFGSRSRARSA